MGFLGMSLKFPVWSRTKSGVNMYDFTSYKEWATYNTALGVSQNHPLLTPALLFIAKIFSQAKFEVIRDSTGKVIKSHPIHQLLKKPNPYQTLPDLLESLSFTMTANGVGVIYKKSTIGMTSPNSLYVLDFNLITFPDSLDRGKFINSIGTDKMMNTTIIYDESEENLKIKLKDLMFFYDMPNGVGCNMFEAESRIAALKQTLMNTQDSLIAKNIIIKSNGKELVSTKKDGMVMTPAEKKDAESLFNTNYGLSNTRKRGLITNASLDYKSLHLIMRDLGHDEGIRTDASIIFAALHLPQDVYSIAGAKSTYKNANQSLVSYIQNEAIPTLESFIAVLNNNLLEDGVSLVGGYDHLPVMLEFKNIKYNGIILQAQALNGLLMSGVPNEVALEMCGFEPTLELGELMTAPQNTSDESSGGDSSGDESDEDKVKRLLENSKPLNSLN